MTKRVSIISINYNQTRVTCELLQSLRKLTYQDVEVIVVDNYSPDDPSQTITTLFPEVKYIRSEINLGFAGGNNLGIKHSTGDYIMFLNNDTEVDPSFLEPLVELFETNPDAGLASSKILYFNSGGVIQYAGSTCINPFTGRNKRIGFMEKDHGQYNSIRETDLGHGAAMMVPRKVIDKIGVMPEFFFLYYEEVDWCESIKRAGYKIYFVPQSQVYHKESMSVGKNSTLRTYYLTRNRLLFMRRNTTGYVKLFWIIFFVMVSLPKNTLQFIVKREINHGKAFWKALFWNVTHLSNGRKMKLFVR
jgi:GT2 family glycosyltransferase